MQPVSVKRSCTPIKAKATLLYKSPTPSKQNYLSQAKTAAKSRNTATPTPQRRIRPKSVNQSFDFRLDSSKMFAFKTTENKVKFDPEAVPLAVFDINACREEVNRLSSQLTNDVLLENKIMRDDWRSAKKSVDFQYFTELKENDRLNNDLRKNFQNFQKKKEKNEKIMERRRKEEEFFASKEAKLKLEREAKVQERDDLQREKSKFLRKQEEKEYKKQLKKFEQSQERESFFEFIDAFKQKSLQEKTREVLERDFDYAQEIGGKWVNLHNSDQKVLENIQVVERLVNS